MLNVNILINLKSEKHNPDWWFVKKPLTMEKGWVPSQCLMDTDSYAQYVETKLNEKIDKLPVFESKCLTYYFEFQSNLFLIYHFLSIHRTRTG